MPDNTLSTLEQIRVKVRRLTRMPSTSQITEDDIDQYVNTFVLYDFPEHLRQFYLRTTLTFYTQPYIDTYSTNTTVTTDPLYNFKNQYTSVHGPVYVAGNPALLSQSRAQFFGMYPLTSTIQSIGATGDGVTTHFEGVLPNVPFLRNNVVISSIDVLNNGIVLVDNGDGDLVVPNGVDTSPLSFIDYVTGVYVINFPVAPAAGAAINSQTVPYVAARPNAVCYYQDSFIVRPVPDQPYPITLEAYRRPTELLLSTDQPELAEWWQYIAYGASKKVLEDRMDMESVGLILPEFKKQETLILRRSLMQYSNERAATIYTEQSGIGSLGNPLGWNGGNF